MDRITVTWHGATVGYMTDSRPDMWYLEGQWHPEPGSHTDAFLARASGLDPRAFMAGTQRGLVVALHEENDSPATKPIVAVVIAPPAQTLCVRQVFDAKAVALVKTWEKEEI